MTFETPDDAAMAVACTGMRVAGRPVNIKFAPRQLKKQANNNNPLMMREPTPRPEGGTNKAFFGNLDYSINVSVLLLRSAPSVTVGAMTAAVCTYSTSTVGGARWVVDIRVVGVVSKAAHGVGWLKLC